MSPQSFLKLETSQRHREHLLQGQTHFANTLNLHTLGTAEECPWTLSMLLIGWFGLPCDADAMLPRKPNWPWHWAAHVSIPPCCFDHTMSGTNVKIYLSMHGRYTFDCGIPPIQNTQIDHTEVARWTLSVSCSIDLDHCLVFAHHSGVIFEHVNRTLKALKSLWQTSLSFLLILLAFWFL